MRVLVCGGRDFNNYTTVCNALNSLFAEADIDLVIHGAAAGADSLAKNWAEEHDIKTLPFPAKWDDLETPPVVRRFRRYDGAPYNAAAGGVRNQKMLDEGKPDLVVAFPGGSGTADMVRRAKAAGVPIKQIET